MGYQKRSYGRRIRSAARSAYKYVKKNYKGVAAAGALMMGGAQVKRVRNVGFGSYTKSKKKYGKGKTAGRGGHFSSCSLTLRRHPKILKRIATSMKTETKLKYVVNGATRLTASIGQQSGNLVHSLCSANELDTLVTNVYTNGNLAFANTTSVLVSKCHAQMTMINQDPGNVRVVVYDLLVRHDGTSTFQTSPNAAWQQGLLDEDGASANWVTPFQTPFTSRLFCETFKVLKATNFILGTGQTHVHNFYFKPNLLINQERLNTIGSNGVIGGVTVMQYIVLLGSVCNDSIVKTQVSTGPAAVDVMFSRQYEVCGSPFNRTIYSQSNNLLTSFTTVGEIINATTGAIIQESAANEA